MILGFRLPDSRRHRIAAKPPRASSVAAWHKHLLADD